MALSATGSGKGGGLLERPVIEKTTPGRESEFDLRYEHKFCDLPWCLTYVFNYLNIYKVLFFWKWTALFS